MCQIAAVLGAILVKVTPGKMTGERMEMKSGRKTDSSAI